MRRYNPTNSITHKVRWSGGVQLFMTPPGVGMASRADVDKHQTPRLKKAAEIVAASCRLISSRFSRRIPISIEVVTQNDQVYVRAGGREAPNAYPFDPPDNPPVRHPVWGHGPRNTWHWAPQPYRPFLEMGAEISIDRAAQSFSQVIDDWCRQSGLTK